jgi:mono/diheme cytochrome c family protein
MIFKMIDNQQIFAVRKYYLILSVIVILLLTACGSQDQQDELIPLVTPTRPSRADVQTSGLIELVDADKNAPYLPPDPSQADLGAQVYFQICLACHGDWGQGLTEEWRETWGEDKNCWQSKCHAPNHPPWGFEIPKYAPPLLGVGSLVRYNTAEELYGHIAKAMPWWNPGSLTEEQAWQVTAYLLRERGELSNDITLDVGNAAVIQLHRPADQPVDNIQGTYFYIGILLLVGIAIIWNFAHELKVLKNRRNPRITTNIEDSPKQTQSGDG